jgi:uncharacterized protein (DUF697 family)
MGVNVGAAFLFREGARALIKFVFPGAGSMVSGAVAFAGTLAIGAAAREYFLRGGSIEDAKRVFAKEKKKAQKESEEPAEKPAADEKNDKPKDDWNVN